MPTKTKYDHYYYNRIVITALRLSNNKLKGWDNHTNLMIISYFSSRQMDGADG